MYIYIARDIVVTETIELASVSRRRGYNQASDTHELYPWHQEGGRGAGDGGYS